MNAILCSSCSGLKRVYLGTAPIGEFLQPYAGSDKLFEKCPNLKDIIVDCDEPQDLWETAFTNGQYVGTTLWVPVGTADKYRSVKGWKNFMKIKEGRPDDSMCMVHTENSDDGSVEMLNTSKKANNNSDFVTVNGNASFVITPDEGMTVDSVIVNGIDMTSSVTTTPANVRAKHLRRAASQTNFMLTLNNIKRNTNVRVVYKEGNGSETFIRNISNTTSAKDTWYTIDGRQLEKKPTKKGIYIHNNKKVFVP